ncbi:hypothetical protein V2J09_018222 [Rumex salicifolius]
MDYGRIDKPQKGGGLSPGKLRNLLMGLEKKRKQEEEEELESHSSLRSHTDESGCYSSSETCKDVDVVTELLECSSLNSSRMKPQEEYELDCDGVSSSAFEFQKTDRAQQRVPAAPFSKPAPSKWDDAQKWIASPTSNRPKMGVSQGGQGGKRASNFLSHGNRQLSLKNVEVMDQRLIVSEEPHTVRMDPRQGKKENGSQNCDGSELYPPDDLYGPPVAVEKSFGVPAISLSQHDSYQTATSFMPAPSMARSISMRDMGTEMTPAASQEPSRTGTPVKVTSPVHSPISSQPSSPRRSSTSAIPADQRNGMQDLNKKDLSDKEIQMKTRREIIALGTKLGKTNIAAWASKEEEDRDAGSSLKHIGAEQLSKTVMEKRAEMWEEAEKAKYLARFEQEEMKIGAWENLQKAKAEAQMRKLEMEIERRKAEAQDRLMNEISAARNKAEAKREAAEMKRDKQAAKTEREAERIKRTGRIPSHKFSCYGWWWCL